MAGGQNAPNRRSPNANPIGRPRQLDSRWILATRRPRLAAAAKGQSPVQVPPEELNSSTKELDSWTAI